MDANKLLQRVFFALLLGVCSFATHEISKLASNDESLNEKMAVMIYSFDELKSEMHELKISNDDLNKRMIYLESRNRSKL